MEVNGQLHTLAALPQGKSPSLTHWKGCRVGPRASLEGVNNELVRMWKKVFMTYFKVLFWHKIRRTGENYKNLRQDSWCPS
jgi:hypothetical protein